MSFPVSSAAHAALATAACAAEDTGKLIPYLVSPDQTVPGVSTYYATTCRECAAACGLIAETRDGRAIKLEGNPDHPLNHGALCARGQAGLQGLYLSLIHISEPTRQAEISYAVFCLKKKNTRPY